MLSRIFRARIPSREYSAAPALVGATIVAFPFLAAAQGAYFLTRFRQNHRDAPRPISPSQGLVIAKSGKEDEARNPPAAASRNLACTCRHRANLTEKCQIPLSLLVIGDSLAAGVGATSGTPKLPEAIARSLSTALGGRTILWTCHGTPGAAASQIIQDIEDIIGEEECRDRNTVDASTTPIPLPSRKNSGMARTCKVPCHDEINKWKMMRRSARENSDQQDHRQYDIVVVLTGLNDLKQIFLPFMQDERANEKGYKEELRRLFMILKEKMFTRRSQLSGAKKSPLTESGNESQRGRHKQPRNQNPLVVMPALPTRPVPLLQYPPLCWIIHGLCELIDEHKRALSMEYPDDILFVEAPSIQMIKEIEKGSSLLVAKRKAETLLLDLNDVTLQVRDKIEKLIKKHETNSHYEEDASEREMELHYEASRQDNLMNIIPDQVGSKLISFDRFHPNNDGYDFWGRHIAEEIIKAWTA